jgi:hypothetical protein
MSSFNNNNGRLHNRYVVPAAGPNAAKPHRSNDDKSSLIPIGNMGYRHFAALAAHDASHKATYPSRKVEYSGRKATPIHHATAPVACVSPPVAPSNIPSAGALGSSGNSVPAERTSGYIHHGRIVPLPKADKLKKAASHGPSLACVVRADPKEVQEFRAGLKAGRNSPLVSGNFPPLVPSHFLKTQDDTRKNAGPSFSSIAAKGVKPGAKISPRSPSSSLPSWSETWMKAEDWFLVLPGQEDLLRRGLGSGFRVQFSGALWEGICEVDEMASRDGASGDFRLGLMKHWLEEQAIVQELVKKGVLKCSVNLPEFIEFIDALGNVDKMYRLPNRKNIPVTSTKKRSPAPHHHQNFLHHLHPSFHLEKTKEKEKLEKYISLIQKETS